MEREMPDRGAAFPLRPTLLSVGVGMQRLMHDEDQRRRNMRSQIEAMMLSQALKGQKGGEDGQTRNI